MHPAMPLPFQHSFRDDLGVLDREAAEGDEHRSHRDRRLRGGTARAARLAVMNRRVDTSTATQIFQQLLDLVSQAHDVVPAQIALPAIAEVIHDFGVPNLASLA